MKIFQSEPVKTAKCRWCNSVFEYTETEKPELPLMCWRCCAAALAKFESEKPLRDQRNGKSFSPLN